MACFVVPAVEAIITTVAAKAFKTKEKKEAAAISVTDGSVGETNKIGFSAKLGWLNKMLWGGSALLAFEHVWHGEIVPYFPFLTAVENGETAEMLAEMGSTGVIMAVLVTAVWGGMVAVSSVIEKRSVQSAAFAEENA